VSQRAGRGGLLVTAGELAAELAQDRSGDPGDPGDPPVLLDVRWRLAGPPGVDSYRQGHLPDAVFVDLDRDLAAPPGPAGRHPLPDPAAFQAAMRAAGVSRDRPVVVYDDSDAMSAARVDAALLRPPGRPGARRRLPGLGRGRLAGQHGRARPSAR
jgi:thiosulfate/3-mercaptopyruvate sulfurtransferase